MSSDRPCEMEVCAFMSCIALNQWDLRAEVIVHKCSVTGGWCMLKLSYPFDVVVVSW